MPPQRALSRALYPAITSKGTLELPTDLFSAGLRPSTDGRGLPDAAMGCLLPSSVVDWEPFKPLPRSYAARVRPQIRPPRVQRGSLKAGEQHQLT